MFATTGRVSPRFTSTAMFEPFFTTRDGGTGYGLYLAAEILKEQGGRLTASNNPEGGACFTIWLPREHRNQLSSPGGRLESGQPRVVLISPTQPRSPASSTGSRPLPKGAEHG